MKAIVIYDSLGGNTEKVADSIYETVHAEELSSDLVKVVKDTEIDFHTYDLVFIGSPVIDWLPTQTMMQFVKRTMGTYNERGLIKPSAPLIPGKFAVCFGTFAGPHIGKTEALPMTMWLRAAMEHMGFVVLDQWHVPGQFRDKEDLNALGRLGNIKNRPNENDLKMLKNRVMGTIASLEAWRN